MASCRVCRVPDALHARNATDATPREPGWPPRVEWAKVGRARESGQRGCGAVGSASPCQGEGREFESRHPLEEQVSRSARAALLVAWPRGEAAACKAVYTGSNPVATSQHPRSVRRRRAIGAAVARFPDTEEVTGSIPVSPTTKPLVSRGFIDSRLVRMPPTCPSDPRKRRIRPAARPESRVSSGRTGGPFSRSTPRLDPP